jgi:hypothetical protein
MKLAQGRIRHLEIKMGHIRKSTFALAAVAALAVGLAGVAEAGKCKGRKCKERFHDEGEYGYVTARATFGGKEVTAPVRPGPHGRPQVEIADGMWLDCEVTCEYTLRRNTVDFWNQFGRDGIVTPGYFRYDFDLDTGEVYRTGPRFLGQY